MVGGFAGREGGFLKSVEEEVEDENEEEEVEMEEEEERGHWVPTSFNLLTPRCGQYRCKASVTVEFVLDYLFSKLRVELFTLPNATIYTQLFALHICPLKQQSLSITFINTFTITTSLPRCPYFTNFTVFASSTPVRVNPRP